MKLTPLINESRYVVEESGRIFDLRRQRYVNPHALRTGHRVIVLETEHGKKHTYLLNKVIWWHFNNEVAGRSHAIVHLDGDHSNCALSNLKLVTRSQMLNEYTRAFNYSEEVTCPKCQARAPLSPKMKYHLKTCQGGPSALSQRGSLAKKYKQTQSI